MALPSILTPYSRMSIHMLKWDCAKLGVQLLIDLYTLIQ